MFKNKILLLAVFLSIGSSLKAQNTLKGVVYDAENPNEFLVGASVIYFGTNTGVSTNGKGYFEMPYVENAKIVVSYVGYKTDTLSIPLPGTTMRIALKNVLNLKEVLVTAEETGAFVSLIKPLNTQIITMKELQKAACCNLSESFETNTSIDISFSDALTGATRLQMLGLEGSNINITTENMLDLRGLATTFGLGYVPGPWLESVQVTKGPASVANGYEGSIGAINLELIEPATADKFALNGYIGNQGRFELNPQWAFGLGKKWKSVLLAHAELNSGVWDEDKDGFLDMPLNEQVNVLNRWEYQSGKNFQARILGKALVENRTSGQVAALDNVEGAYGINIKTQRAGVDAKLGWLFPETPWRGLGVLASATYHNQESIYGKNLYQGKQQTVLFNQIYQTKIGDTRHKLKTGVSFLGDVYTEMLNDSAFNRTEFVPGAFMEYHYQRNEKQDLILGVRADYHNLFGIQATPRISFKQNFGKAQVFRASFGSAFRSVNILAENSGILASSRTIEVQEDLSLLESTWGGGLNYSSEFHIFNKKSTVNVDFYHTSFTNQVVVDRETPQIAKIYNLDGKSYSNSYQIEWNYEFIKGFESRLGYRIERSFITFGDELLLKPFVPAQKVLFNLAYASRFEKWKADFTTQWYDQKRIPGSAEGVLNFSDSYFIFNAQVARKFKHWEVYVGSENIGGFVQDNPILGMDEPYGPQFDAGLVWGPMFGRRIYAGFRIKFNP